MVGWLVELKRRSAGEVVMKQLMCEMAGRVAWAVVAMMASGGVGHVSAAEPVRSQGPDFLRDIRPIFKAHCFRCHGPGNNEGEFRLDRKPLAMKGGETGRALVPGQAETSLLVRLVKGRGPGDARMPPEGEGRA